MPIPVPERPPLTSYQLSVYADTLFDPDDVVPLTEAVDDEIHDALFALARNLERRHGVRVLAIDEHGAGWIAGGLGARHELRFERTIPVPPVATPGAAPALAPGQPA